MKAFGLIFTLIAILLGFWLAGGAVSILWQPVEILVILGGGFGSFIFSNPGHVVKDFFTHARLYFSGGHFGHKAYQELLNLSIDTCDYARQKGIVALMQDTEKGKIDLFSLYPKFKKDPDNEKFFNDSFLLFSMTSEQEYFKVEMKIKERIKNNAHDTKILADAIQKLGESMPAFGIVAAVLGIILTMGVINEDVSVIGRAISAALVGTLLGLLFGYGIFIPIANTIKSYANEQESYQQSIFNAVRLICLGSSSKVVREELLLSFPYHIQKKLPRNG